MKGGEVKRSSTPSLSTLLHKRHSTGKKKIIIVKGYKTSGTKIIYTAIIMSRVKTMEVGGGDDVISSHQIHRVTSTVRGEKVHSGSNNNKKKKPPYGGQTRIHKTHSRTTMESAMCVPSIFRDKTFFSCFFSHSGII